MIIKQLMIYVNAVMTIILIAIIASNLILGNFKLAWIVVIPLIYSILNVVGLEEN